MALPCGLLAAIVVVAAAGSLPPPPDLSPEAEPSRCGPARREAAERRRLSGARGRPRAEALQGEPGSVGGARGEEAESGALVQPCTRGSVVALGIGLRVVPAWGGGWGVRLVEEGAS